MNNVKTVGKLSIYDNGNNGLSWEFKYKDDFGGEHIDFNGISGNDMLEYTFEELIPYNFDKKFSDAEKELFISEFNRIKGNARYLEEIDLD